MNEKIVADVLEGMIDKYERRVLQIEELWPKGPEYCPSGVLEEHDRMSRMIVDFRWRLRGMR